MPQRIEMVELDASAVIQLHAAQRVTVEVDRAEEALGSPALDWLGAAMGNRSGRRTYRCDLHSPLRAAGHAVDFHKAALVDLGPLRREDGHLLVDISWRSANLAPLFPVFSGRLTVASDRVSVDGWYAPPGGRIGMAIDRLLLRLAARRTAAWFLRLVAEELGSGPARREQ